MNRSGGAVKAEFSYAHAVGVTNTRTKTVTANTVADMRRRPVFVDTGSAEYHKSSKKRKNQIKLPLPYFVGGTLDGKRDNDNVRARTLLTLDVEAKEGKRSINHVLQSAPVN